MLLDLELLMNYDQAEHLGKLVGVEPIMPRIAQRQSNRSCHIQKLAVTKSCRSYIFYASDILLHVFCCTC